MSSGEGRTVASALEDNILSKGKNAYYFAHAHKATGPKWDGKEEPRLLSRSESHTGHRVKSSFEYSKSNITTYAFLDDGMKVKLYLNLDGVGEKCTDDDIELDFTDSSLSLVVKNYASEPQVLSFAKLTGEISTASFRRKENRIIVTLTKAIVGEWHTINDKGAPDHEIA